MATAGELYNLQKVDTMTAKVRRRLLQIQKKLGDSPAVTAARATVEETEQQLHQWHGRQTDAELESQSLKKRIQETEDQLMSGAIKVPKELENLQTSLDSLKRHRESVDEKAVEAMEKVDELTASLETAQADLTRLEGEWRAGQGDLTEAESKMKRNFMILRKQRELLLDAIDDESLQEYEHLRKRKGGVAVAPVEDDTCGACHVQLPTGVIHSASSSGTQRVFCPSCGRLLYAE